MNSTLVAVSCLLCGVLLGFVLNTVLLFGGFEWPGMQKSKGSTDVESVSNGLQPSTSTSIAKQSRTENSSLVNQEQEPKQIVTTKALTEKSSTAAPQDSDLQFELLQNMGMDSSIDEQRQVLELIANASIDEINSAIAEIPNDNNRIHEQRWFIGLLAQRKIELDPEMALQELTQSLTSQTGMGEQSMVSYLMIESYARSQPESLLAWIESQPDDAVHPDQMMGLYSALAQSAPESALELMMQNSSLASNRYGGPEMILYTWSERDPQAALQWLERHGDEQLLNQHAESILSQLAYRDPEAARELSANYPGLVSDELFVMQEIQTLAESDPLAALEMARSMSGGDYSSGAMHSVFYTWSSKDPIAAVEYVDSISDLGERDMAVQMIAGSIGSIAAHSPAKREELLSWSESLSPDVRLAVREPILSSWMEYEPEAALAWVNSQGDATEQARMLQSIAWILPEHDLQQAMDLFVGANRDTQMSLSHGIISKLYESDPDAAWRWYEELPVGELKQGNLFGLIMMTAQDNPQQALQMASEMSNDTNIDVLTSGSGEMFPGVLQAIAMEFPEEAEIWLATSNLDEQQKQELRDSIAQFQMEMGGFPMPGSYRGMPPPPNSSFYRMEY